MLPNLRTTLVTCTAMVRSVSILRHYLFTATKMITPETKDLSSLDQIEEKKGFDMPKGYMSSNAANILLKQNGFNMEESSNTSEIRLVKYEGNKRLSIIYKAKMVNCDIADKTETPDMGTEFAVFIQNNDGSGLLVNCSSEYGKMVIDSVSYSNNLEDTIENQNEFPSLEISDEKFIKKLTKYLNNIGLNKEVLMSIECSAATKYQKKYMKWFCDIKEETKDK